MEAELTLKDGRTLRVSQARVEDTVEILAYTHQVCTESDFLTFGPGEFEMSIADEEKFIADLDGGSFNFMLVGRVDARIVSVCTVLRRRRPRIRHLGEFGISVARSHWRVGVGRAMCTTMLQVARRVGVTKIDLKVSADNAAAIRLYERVGFVREGVTKRGLRLSERYVDDIMMGLCLDG